jgi:16S rRNA (cytosine1402-N4)-methyltransferase
MQAEVLAHLSLPREGALCVDATIDGGGHAAAILAATAPTGRVLGIDRDPEMLRRVRVRLSAEVEAGRLLLATASFTALAALLVEYRLDRPQCVLFDLGLSSFHLDRSGRGFSLAAAEPLDMRFDATPPGSETAADILATRDSAELTAIFRDYGEERFASRIARTIVARRREVPLRTASDLRLAIETALPANTRWRSARHAARVFQALRIAVNDELAAVREALPQAVASLAPGGRLVVISFHSIEDRLVKNFFRAERDAGRLRILTKRPLQPSDEEIAANPRAASAKLRAAERTVF